MHQPQCKNDAIVWPFAACLSQIIIGKYTASFKDTEGFNPTYVFCQEQNEVSGALLRFFSEI